MTPQRIRDAAQILGQVGNGKMANELDRLAKRYCWRPIAELHEDYGQCVLMHIDDPGHMEVGSNLDVDFDASLWTHFAQIVPLGQEEYGRLREAMKSEATA